MAGPTDAAAAAAQAPPSHPEGLTRLKDGDATLPLPLPAAAAPKAAA